MTSAFVAKLSLNTQKNSVTALKIDNSSIETYRMALARFLIEDSLGSIWFFEETFLLVNISMKMVLGMFFPSLNNVAVKFAELGKLTWRSYITAKAFLNTSRVEFIDKREFAKVALDANSKTFVIYMSVLEATKGPTIHLFWAAQIVVL